MTPCTSSCPSPPDDPTRRDRPAGRRALRAAAEARLRPAPRAAVLARCLDPRGGCPARGALARRRLSGRHADRGGRLRRAALRAGVVPRERAARAAAEGPVLHRRAPPRLPRRIRHRMSQTYDSSSIQVLEGLEAVRRRPAMYIGDTSEKGLHHCVFEVVDNSIDEALAGYCKNIDVVINADGSVSVTDDGRGSPVDVHPTEGVPAVEVIMMKLHAGGKFDKGSYKVSGGLHGVGVSCVNALAEWLDVEIYRNEKVYSQTFQRGEKATELTVTGASQRTGTKVTFKPDPTIVETVEFGYDVLAKRLREVAFLMGKVGVRIHLSEETTGREDEYWYPNGLEDFIRFLNANKEPIHPKILVIDTEVPDSKGSPVQIECALQYNDGYREDVYCFVNNINTTEGGTHLSGFRSGLTRVLNAFAK